MQKSLCTDVVVCYRKFVKHMLGSVLHVMIFVQIEIIDVALWHISILWLRLLDVLEALLAFLVPTALEVAEPIVQIRAPIWVDGTQFVAKVELRAFSTTDLRLSKLSLELARGSVHHGSIVETCQVRPGERE